MYNPVINNEPDAAAQATSGSSGFGAKELLVTAGIVAGTTFVVDASHSAYNGMANLLSDLVSKKSDDNKGSENNNNNNNNKK